MLIVLIHNLGTRPDNTARYEVEVRVNRDTIWKGQVGPHQRDDGWTALLRLVAEEAERNP